MPSKSKKQAKTMTAACKNPKFRKKVGIAKKVACDFHRKDKGKYHESYKDREGYIANPSKKQRAAIQATFKNQKKSKGVAGWITSDLKIHRVGEPGEHYVWLIDHFNLNKNEIGFDNVYRMGFAHGYVRYRSTAGYLDVEGKKENVHKTEKVWRQFAKNRQVYITYVDYPKERSVLESQLNEVSEYLGRSGETGGWITQDKKVHPVDSHYVWVGANYGGIDSSTGAVSSFNAAFEDGAVRYVLGQNGLELNGFSSAIKSLFNIWWPTAARKNSVLIDPAEGGEKLGYDQYHMPEHKQNLLSKWRPEHPLRTMVKKFAIDENIQLNELREYLGQTEDEYGGWITPDKKVHPIKYQGHHDWARTQYGFSAPGYRNSFEHGNVRYQLERLALNLEGKQEDLENTFYIWWPTAVASGGLHVDYVSEENSRISDYDYFDMSNTAQKIDAREKFKPKPKIKEASGFYNQDKKKDRSLGASYTVSIYKHQVNNIDEDKWNESVKKVKDVKSGMPRRSALMLQRKIIDELKTRNSHNDNGWVDYFTRIQEDHVNETEGGTVGFMFRGGYYAGMKTTAKNTKKRRKLSPLGNGKINEDMYGSDSTPGWITPKGQVYDNVDHGKWVKKNYGTYKKTFDAGCVRFRVTSNDDLVVQGTKDALQKLFRKWYPLTINSNHLFVDLVTEYETLKDFQDEMDWDQNDISTQEDFEGYYELGPFPKDIPRNSFKFNMRTDRIKVKKMFGNRKIKVSEKYNTNSTWLKVGKNIVEVILNKETRRIKRGNKITEEEIPTYKIFVDGVNVGYVDNIDEIFLVKDDKSFDKYDNLEEAISKVMGSSYYDGKGTTEFAQFDPDPIH